MKTTAYLLVAIPAGIVLQELSKPPHGAKDMAEEMGRVKPNSHVSHMHAEGDDVNMSAVFWGTNCLLFVDSEQEIKPEWISDAIAALFEGSKVIEINDRSRAIN